MGSRLRGWCTRLRMPKEGRGDSEERRVAEKYWGAGLAGPITTGERMAQGEGSGVCVCCFSLLCRHRAPCDNCRLLSCHRFSPKERIGDRGKRCLEGRDWL